jgi:hypothetical protein
MVTLIRHVQITGGIHGNSKRIVEPCGAARSIGTANCSRSASQRGHHAGLRDFAHGIVRAISDVDIPRLIDGNSIHATETSVTACSVSKTATSGESRQRGYYTGRRDFAYGKIGGIGDIDVPGANQGTGKSVAKDGLPSCTVASVGIAGKSVKIVRNRVAALRLRTKGDE